MQRRTQLVALALLAACAAACAAPSSTSEAGALELSAEDLHDPATCKSCHAEHYREWQSSMHAYAAQDPVFFAMNERGQQETHGELGDFCVRCHAPMAVELGLTRDGLNLADLKLGSARGVTCYTCHNAVGVDDDHNQHLRFGRDAVLHGGLGPGATTSSANQSAPRPNRAHESRYSALHDGTSLSSASLCGSCHDVINGHGVNIERTFAEWRVSRYAQPGPDQRTCGACHMPSYSGRATAGGPERTLHRHMFAAVDVALERSFPGIEAQKAASECLFSGAIDLTLQNTQGSDVGRSFEVVLANQGVGHAFPSGSAQDRRAWVEFIAYDAAGKAFFKSGAISEGDAVPGAETGLVVLRDQLLGAQGELVHTFWEATPSPSQPLGYQSNLLGQGATRALRYDLPQAAARVTARLLLRPMGLEVLDSFQGLLLPISERVIDMGYLDDGPLRSRFRTRTIVGTEREWRSEPSAQPASPDAGGELPRGCAEHAYVTALPQ